MAEEKKKKERKFYQKKRYIIPSGLILFFVAIGIWAQKEINTLIDECNRGSIESCKKLEDTYPSSYDSLNSRIPIYYFKIFDMNDLDKSIHISSKLSENFDIQNEGNDPISSYWNTVRNYLEAKTIMINDYNRCK